MAVQAVRNPDPEAAKVVTDMSGEVRELADDLMSRLAVGLEAGGAQNLATQSVVLIYPPTPGARPLAPFFRGGRL